MKAQNIFLKRIALASMVTAFVVNNAQAMETDTNNVEVVVVEQQEQVTPEGPARQKYNDIEHRYEKVEPSLLKEIGKAGLVIFLANGVAIGLAAAAGVDRAELKELASINGLMSGLALAGIAGMASIAYIGIIGITGIADIGITGLDGIARIARIGGSGPLHDYKERREENV